MIAEPADLLGQQIDALREAIQRLAAVAQQPAEPQSSVELAQNAKGATQIAVKVYHRDPQQAAATAQRLYDGLAATYRAAAPGCRPGREGGMTACLSRVYVIHFDRTYRSGRHHGARNYTGIALDGDVQRRLAEHLDVAACQRAGRHLPGHRGSPLVCAVLRAGIAVRLVLNVPGDRKLERRWKARHATRICPECAPRHRGGGPGATSAPASCAGRRGRWRQSRRHAHAV